MIKAVLQKNLIGTEGIFNLDVSIEINSNDFIIIFGKSGSGKTTILRMLAGLTEPDNGYINVNDLVWYDSTKKIKYPTRKRKIGFVFQDYALFPNMTVRKNLEFALEDKKKLNFVDEILEIVDLTELGNRKPLTLSGGQKQRVALARALMRKPDILLLDEPLSALDFEIRNKLQDELQEIHQKFNITTIMVTHDLNEAFKLSDKVLVLDKGKIINHGKASDVLCNISF